MENNKELDFRENLVEWREVIELLVSCSFFFFFSEVDVKVNLQQKVSQQEHICENRLYHLITEILVAA